MSRFRFTHKESRPNGLPVMKRTYKGFHLVMNPDHVDDSGQLVLAFIEGDVEIWAVDGERGLEALKEFYKDTGWEDSVWFRVYKEESDHV